MDKLEISFRSMADDDWRSIAKIYKQGIETNNATFEQEIPTQSDWDKKYLQSCRIVAVINDEIAGWAALSPVSARNVYRGVAEVSVYVDSEYHGRKIGSKLLEQLINESEKNNIWTLQAGIFPENEASIKMHTGLGFRIVGFREKIGKMNGVWRDTILLERRSKKIID